MEKVERFSVSMSPALIKAFDEEIKRKGYSTRSEGIRDIVRQYLVDSEWKNQDEADVVGTVTIVYDHHRHDLGDELVDLQHQNYKSILCTTHIHLDAHNCLEIIVIRGKASVIKNIADRLISTRGVKHGKLVCTTTGKEIE